MVIYFIMQSLLEIRSKHLPCFPSKRESRQSAILFFVVVVVVFLLLLFFVVVFFFLVNSRSDSYANKSYVISSLSIHFIVKMN